MLVDNVRIYVKAGNGGNGCVSFRREKYVSHGGPDGGDGGNGGNIIVKVDEGANTLLYYKYKHKFVAKNGDDGKAAKFHGKTGENLILPVPPGTVIRDSETGKVIKDMTGCDEFLLCKGGKGGWGNQHFATPTRQIPRFAKSGMLGEEKEVILELKMIADVGLIGFPNVGKSSILTLISNSRPKIANYHFTTLSPSLGVVSTGEESGFVAADIPGLIEGAAEGAGLGHEFLRHVERCRLLLHVVDVSGIEGRDPIDDIKLINSELRGYNDTLASLPQIIVANKTDLCTDKSALEDFEEFVDMMGYELIYISAATGENIKNLVMKTAEKLSTLPPIVVYESEITEDDTIPVKLSKEITIVKENGVYFVEGEWLYKLMGSINFDDRESLSYFQRSLRSSGIIDKLEEAGVKDGDTVNMYDFEFDFIK